MKQFIKIFMNKSALGVEEAVNKFAEENSVEIVSANTFINQGVFYATVIFAEKPKARAKKECAE
jgi:hypothetical protein